MAEQAMKPEHVVASLFAALRSRDFAAARSLWADDAVWHANGTHDLAGDYSPDEYLAMMTSLYERWPGYAATGTPLRTEGEQGVMLHLTSSGGPAPGTASGWMLYRVNDGKIAEGWAIPTFEDGRYPF